MKKYFAIFSLFILLFGRLYLYLVYQKSYKEGDVIRITSRVTSEPLRFESKQYLKLLGLKIYLPLYPEISYGDNIVIEGKVLKDELDAPKLVDYKKNNNLGYIVRQKIIDNYKKALPKPHSSLVSGMVLGSKSDIPQDFWESLKSTGTAHVVVASGMNISLVGSFLITFLTIFWKRGRALLVTIIGIWLYAFLTGFDAPIVRASVMGTVSFMAQYFGRMSEAIRALFVSALIMLMVNPSYLWDLGFLLSFFATLSLIVFEPKVKSLILRVGPLQGSDPVSTTIINDLSTSIAAQIGVSPLLYFYFGQINIFSPLINTLILFTVVPITILGMTSGVVGLIFEPLGRLILYLVYPLTSWFIWIVTVFS